MVFHLQLYCTFRPFHVLHHAKAVVTWPMVAALTEVDVQDVFNGAKILALSIIL